MSDAPSNHPIVSQQQGAVAVLTLNRPDTRNALSGEAMFAACFGKRPPVVQG